MPEIKIGERTVGDGHMVYFIAEIGANHEGSLERAKMLIKLAAEAGADAVKFQHYSADTIASAPGFDGLSLSHYTDNPHSVFKKYEVPWEWTEELKMACMDHKVEFLSTPYSLEAVERLSPYVNAWKIGSGDITWHQLIKACAGDRTRPVILSTGASDSVDVEMAMSCLRGVPTVVMQCNTNYTESCENETCLNLRVIPEYQRLYPSAVIGLSDHMTNIDIVVAAVALGASVIERHFTDNPLREGPDHPFAMNPDAWDDMVFEARRVQRYLGSWVKKVEENEKETVILQRRCLRASKPLPVGHRIVPGDLEALRPAPPDSLEPYMEDMVLYRKLKRSISRGDYIRETDVY